MSNLGRNLEEKMVLHIARCALVVAVASHCAGLDSDLLQGNSGLKTRVTGVS
jgi:hypothetical protein